MILCCGEALIDMIPGQTTDGRTAFVPHSGGAVFNTAIALGRLGQRTGLLTGLSTDMFGAQLLGDLAASGVETAFAVRSDRPSTLAFVELKDGHASYAFFDENSAGRMLRPGDMPPLPADIDAMFFGGISLACEPGADAYADLLDRAAGGRIVMIDPNIRPGFIADEVRYRARLDAMLSKSDIVKISDEDLAWLLPGPATLSDKMRVLAEKGPSLILMTQGGDGATSRLQDGTEVSASAPQVTVVDTVGAGDTFNAGVLASLAEQNLLSRDEFAAITPDQVKTALEFGVRVAAITVSRAGANPPWAKDLSGGSSADRDARSDTSAD